LSLLVAGAVYGVPLASANVLRVGTWNGRQGQFKTIQAAVKAAHPGDWVLVGPGDYKEEGYAGEAEPAGVLITTPNIHLRGMDRNTVVVDGTKRGTPECSSRPGDQGTLNRNGVEVYKANNTWIENLTVCNFLDGSSGGEQIWWNGGDGSGHIGLSGFWGNYLTATSSYSSSVAGALGACCGVSYPAADYGIFSSNATNGWFKHSYASNMADAAYYIGACQQVCNQVMQYNQGEGSALCLSSTNAGGYLQVDNNECDNNKTGLVSNSQNNDDWPSPQIGLCPAGRTGPLGTQSCTVWMNNFVHDNNEPNVPGNGSGLSGGAPVGMNTVAWQPSAAAARATPWAWLPAEAATTPRARSSSDSLAIRVYAPRTLNEPARWRFSHFRYAGPPTLLDSSNDRSSGVTRTMSSSVRAAARMSSSVTRLPICSAIP